MSERQYSFEAYLEYRVLRGSQMLQSGWGRMVSMCRSEIVFKASEPLPAGFQIELYIDWPTPVGSAAALRLHARGEIKETRDGGVVVRLLRYEFQTAHQSHSS